MNDLEKKEQRKSTNREPRTGNLTIRVVTIKALDATIGRSSPIDHGAPKRRISITVTAYIPPRPGPGLTLGTSTVSVDNCFKAQTINARSYVRRRKTTTRGEGKGHQQRRSRLGKSRQPDSSHVHSGRGGRAGRACPGVYAGQPECRRQGEPIDRTLPGQPGRSSHRPGPLGRAASRGPAHDCRALR